MTMAARSDPWVRDREPRAQIAEHQSVLAAQPLDRVIAAAGPDIGDAAYRRVAVEGTWSGDDTLLVRSRSLNEQAGYHVERHEDVDETGKERQKEVGRGDRYKQPNPR